ncbi:uncharacterized protein LOC123545774 [Mercenaria mercenaria]|uniref:uncharacterized protein LOC123545774 n=1 Tax=Mercenaria mercenaria TaxID=6596 RepID=UPI00234F9AE1|nr:uncharacterized protein LOC123545774 [Mercenaria mercenaria]
MKVVGKVIRYLQVRSQKTFEYIEDKALRIGKTLDEHMDSASPGETIVCKVLLRLPLICIIQQWLLLSPYSNYWVLEIFLFIVRYGVALLLVGACTLNSGVILQFYTISTMDIAVMWLKRTDYWTHRNMAYSVLHDKNILVWSNVTEHWRVLVLCSSLLQVVYLCYRPGTLIHREKLRATTGNYITLFATMVPNILSTFGFIPFFMSKLSYWVESTLLFIICMSEMRSLRNLDLDVDRKKLKMLTDDRMLRRKYSARIKDLQQRINNRRGIGYYANNYLGQWIAKYAVLAFGAIVSLWTRRKMTSSVILNTLLDVSTMLCATVVSAIRSLLPKFIEQIF